MVFKDLYRTSARVPGNDENAAPPDVLMEGVAASRRPPIASILTQARRQVPSRTAPNRMPAPLGIISYSAGTSARKPTTVVVKTNPAASLMPVEVPHFKLQEDPIFWEDNNIKVIIRVRPLSHAEKNQHNHMRCLQQTNGHVVTWLGPPKTDFKFDHVACEGIDQEEIFRVTGLPIVEKCMAGHNTCVFAYGQHVSNELRSDWSAAVFHRHREIEPVLSMGICCGKIKCFADEEVLPIVDEGMLPIANREVLPMPMGMT